MPRWGKPGGSLCSAMFNWAYDLEHVVPGALLGAGVAALIGATALLLFAWPWRRPGRSRAALAWALGVGLGLLGGCLVLKVAVAWPPLTDQHRLLLLIWPAALLVECLAALPRLPRAVAWAARLALAGVAARVVLHQSEYLGGPAFDPSWTTVETV